MGYCDAFLSRYSTSEAAPVDQPGAVCMYRTFKQIATQTTLLHPRL